MAQSDKLNPSRRWEDQDVDMTPTVVPPGAFADPNRPEAAGGKLSLSLSDHPLEISEDYAAAQKAAAPATETEDKSAKKSEEK